MSKFPSHSYTYVSKPYFSAACLKVGLLKWKIQKAELVKVAIAYVEKRTKISVKKHLDFGDLHTPLKTKTDSEWNYCGELNADGKEHGRGILILNSGTIYIGYFENGVESTGNHIRIYCYGEFEVGERYFKDGRICDRGTMYYTDGIEKKYDF